MAELREGQHIIFKHPVYGHLRCGCVVGAYVVYCFEGVNTTVPINRLKEWCDAEAAFNAWGLQQVRAGNFEWSEGPTVEPIK